jgi:glyceraldehyde 3-phosphate dehydrogenase
MTTVHAVTIN